MRKASPSLKGFKASAKLLSRVQLSDPVDCSPPGSLSMGFSRQEYWSGLPGPPPGDLPDPGVNPVSLTSPALAGKFFIPSATWEARPELPPYAPSDHWGPRQF